jgi:hypothetical protein
VVSWIPAASSPRKAGWGAEPLVTNSDNLPIRQPIALFQRRRLSSSLQFLFKVKRNVTQLLFDVPDDLTFGRSERVPALHQVLDQEISQVASGEIESEDSVRERESFVDGHGMRHSVSGIEDNSGCAAD